MIFSPFSPCLARDLDRLESTRDVVLWLIMSTGAFLAFIQ
jgi:hypothetical protein